MAYGRNSRSYRAAPRSRSYSRPSGGRRSAGRAVRSSRGGKRSLVGRGRVGPQTVKLQLQIVGAPATATSPFLGQELKEVPKGRAKF